MTVSTKVRRELLERARRLGINVSEFLRERLEEEVQRREAEELRAEIRALRDVLERVNVNNVVRDVREAREGR